MINKIKEKIKNYLKYVVTIFQKEQNTQIDQVQIANQYRLMKKILSPAEMPTLKDVGFKVRSQFEEDGILLYIFSIIGTTNKKVIELCAGNGTECMAANLIINHGWDGLLFDGDERLVKQGIKFFSSNQSTWRHPPIFKQAWLTRENIDQLIIENKFTGGIDLLSLDIDGNDYYIMNAINSIKPRVIICETNNVIPSELSLTIPYKPGFNRKESLHRDFLSVSLLAMKKLLVTKGYRLIGSHRFGFNAIFMLNTIGIEYFPEVKIESVHDNSYTKFRNSTTWKKVKDLPWVVI